MIGDLDRLIQIMVQQTVTDPVYGTESAGAWVPLPGVVDGKVWAEWRPVPPSRNEMVRQGLEQARDQVRIRIRYRPDISSTMQIVYEGHWYAIVGGPEEVMGRHRYLEMVAERYSSASTPVVTPPSPPPVPPAVPPAGGDPVYG